MAAFSPYMHVTHESAAELLTMLLASGWLPVVGYVDAAVSAVWWLKAAAEQLLPMLARPAVPVHSVALPVLQSVIGPAARATVLGACVWCACGACTWCWRMIYPSVASSSCSR